MQNKLALQLLLNHLHSLVSYTNFIDQILNYHTHILILSICCYVSVTSWFGDSPALESLPLINALLRWARLFRLLNLIE